MPSLRQNVKKDVKLYFRFDREHTITTVTTRRRRESNRRNDDEVYTVRFEQCNGALFVISEWCSSALMFICLPSMPLWAMTCKGVHNMSSTPFIAKLSWTLDFLVNKKNAMKNDRNKCDKSSYVCVCVCASCCFLLVGNPWRDPFISRLIHKLPFYGKWFLFIFVLFPIQRKLIVFHLFVSGATKDCK